VLDEEDCVDELAGRIEAVLAGCDVRHEILFVDDGSRDATPARLHALRAANPAIKSIRFTRSFGHQAALMGGLAHARGDAVVTMDGDLQHPPELLPAMLAAWRAGADVVHTVRHSAPGERRGAGERSSRAFYRLMNATTGIEIVPAGADFRLLDRAAVDALNALPERSVFLRGLVPWLGCRTRSQRASRARANIRCRRWCDSHSTAFSRSRCCPCV
jgi:dolichol-phosphate mannosyltransferase